MNAPQALARRFPFLLPLLVACGDPTATELDQTYATGAATVEADAPAAPPADFTPVEGEWLRDHLPPAAGFPFHIYWHRDPPVPERVKDGVRKAAVEWALIVSPTPVVPYVFENRTQCGTGAVMISYEAGDTLAGGFHLYVSSDTTRNEAWRALAFGPCAPDYHPVTNAPPNGHTWMHPEGMLLESDRLIEVIALHEIGHLLGLGIGERWYAGLVTDTLEGYIRPLHFQTDSAAIAKYIELASRAPQDNSVYEGRKMPVSAWPSGSRVHWHYCTLSSSGGGTNIRVTDVMSQAGSMEGAIVTPVTASMLQGFRVNWDYFDDWYPEPYWFSQCPEHGARSDRGARGADGDHGRPNPVFQDDVRRWDYVRMEAKLDG